MVNKKLVTFLLLVSVVGGVVFLNSCLNKEKITQQNKTIASTMVHEALEKGTVDMKYLDPNIEIEYPAEFKFPPLGTNKIKGIESLENIVKTWKSDTAHEVDLVDVIAEGDKVVVVTNSKRIFNMNQEQHVYNDHLFVHIFQFKNGKVINIKSVFDVVDHIEQHKAEKYQFKQEKK